MIIQEINSENFSERISHHKLSLIDIWAPWCGPCKMIQPILEEVNQEIGESVYIAKMNADDNMETCKEFSVRNIPTLLFFKDGNLVDRMSGAKSKKDILEFIEKNSETSDSHI